LTNKQSILAKIPVIFFEEGDKLIAYSPALDLSTCGDNLEQAKKRFAEAATIFINEASQMGTLEEVLAECGWQKTPSGQAWTPPLYVGQLQEEIEIPAVR